MNRYGTKFTINMLVFVVVAVYMASMWYRPVVKGTDDEVMSIRPHSIGSPAYVIAKAKCVVHSGNDFPTGVVYQTADGTAHHSTSPVTIGKALDEEIDGIDWKNKTNIFCN